MDEQIWCEGFGGLGSKGKQLVVISLIMVETVRFWTLKIIPQKLEQQF